MSERYGTCQVCHGKGKVVIATVPADKEDPTEDDETYETYECPRCGGTGFSGAATDLH